MSETSLFRLYLIRHGQVKGNTEKRFVGLTDESLSEEGRAVICEAAEKGCYPVVDILFSSPLKRCLETAAIVFPEQKPICIPELAEIDFGDFEYKNYLELSDDPRFQEWIDSGGEKAFPGGESRAEYCVRVVRGFEEICRKMQALHARGMKAAAVVHLGTIKALLSTLAGLGYFDIQASNGGGFVLTVDAAAGKITEIREFTV